MSIPVGNKDTTCEQDCSGRICKGEYQLHIPARAGRILKAVYRMNRPRDGRVFADLDRGLDDLIYVTIIINSGLCSHACMPNQWKRKKTRNGTAQPIKTEMFAAAPCTIYVARRLPTVNSIHIVVKTTALSN